MSMRREVLVLACLCVTTAAACGSLVEKLKNKGDAGAADAAVIEPESSGSGISNEKAITRYPDEEVSLDNEVELTASAVVRSSWPGTDMVATLKSGSTVMVLAAKGDGALVVFEDAGDKKMGWIGMKSVPPIAIPEAGARDQDDDDDKKTNTTTVKSDAGVKPKDAGTAVVDAGAPPPVKDAGTAVVDAGAPASVKDAGAPATPKDAGGGGGGSSSGPLVKEMVGDKCDSGYAEFPKGEKKCRKLCTSDAQCSGGKCVQKSDKKYCYSTTR